MKKVMWLICLVISASAFADGIEQRRADFKKIGTDYELSSKALTPASFDSKTIWDCTSYEIFATIDPYKNQVHFGPSEIAGYNAGGIARWRNDDQGPTTLAFYFDLKLNEWISHNVSYGVAYVRGNGQRMIIEYVLTPGMFALTWQVLCESSEKNCVVADSVSSPDHNVGAYSVCTPKDQ